MPYYQIVFLILQSQKTPQYTELLCEAFQCGAFQSSLGAHLIFVTTITTAGCVKNLAKCKIFQLERKKLL